MINETELVSVIMPSYNTAKYIKQSIESVLNQTYENLELIIIDDCSTDDTDDMIATIKDSRIIYIKNKINSGAAVSRNLALKMAHGKWIAFLDSDDIWFNTKLEKQIDFMRKNNYHFTYTNYCEIDEDTNEIGTVVSGPKKITKHGMYNFCWQGCLTVMYDAEFVGLIQIKDIKKNNDYAMWLKVCKKTNCYLLDEILAKYRRGRSGSISTQKYTTLIKWHYKLYRTCDNRNVVSASLLTCRNLFFGLFKKIIYVKE